MPAPHTLYRHQGLFYYGLPYSCEGFVSPKLTLSMGYEIHTDTHAPNWHERKYPEHLDDIFSTFGMLASSVAMFFSLAFAIGFV